MKGSNNSTIAQCYDLHQSQNKNPKPRANNSPRQDNGWDEGVGNVERKYYFVKQLKKYYAMPFAYIHHKTGGYAKVLSESVAYIFELVAILKPQYERNI